MGKITQKSVQVMLRYIADHEKFTLAELCDAIEARGGILRLGPCWSVEDALNALVRIGELERDKEGNYMWRKTRP